MDQFVLPPPAGPIPRRNGPHMMRGPSPLIVFVVGDRGAFQGRLRGLPALAIHDRPSGPGREVRGKCAGADFRVAFPVPSINDGTAPVDGECVHHGVLSSSVGTTQ